ncbi:MAG: nicotinate phosphoribosyltransferase [Chloroflexota bacterium]
MTVFDQTRLTDVPFGFDKEALRRGTYADKYFENVRRILQGMARDGATYADFDGNNPRALPIDPATLNLGDIVVEAQVFTRRKPRALIAGIDAALWMLRHGTGYYDENDAFVEMWQNLDVTAVYDGVWTEYKGDPMEVETVLEVRGRYRDFAVLETTLLGVLSRASRIATNVYNLHEATNGKPLLFFPARFDLPAVQAADGYAYWLAVQRLKHDTGLDLRPFVSTDAQGLWWGGKGGGTVPHAIVASFLADTVAAMKAFAKYIPAGVPRIVLADFNNDSVTTAVDTLTAYWHNYVKALEAGDENAQTRWTLNGVRLDTGGTLVDRALQPDGKTGVNEDLVWAVRHALDGAWQAWDVPERLKETAQTYCKQVGITVSGGFNYEKISRFEENGVPVASYGVGSSLFSNESSLGTNTDFTMDVVRVQLDGEWVPIAKVGRQPCDNDDLRPVDLSIFS